MGGAQGLPVHGACSELTRVPHAWPGDWRAALWEQVPRGSRLSACALQSWRRARAASPQEGPGGEAAGSAGLGKARALWVLLGALRSFPPPAGLPAAQPDSRLLASLEPGRGWCPQILAQTRELAEGSHCRPLP